MSEDLVVPEPNGRKRVDLRGDGRANRPLSPIQVHCAMLIGQGHGVSAVANHMLDYIIQKSSQPKDIRLRMCRNRIRKWQRRQDFRDLIYESAIIAADNQVPDIIKGVTRKAKAGRVDAAKLILELAQRYQPKGEGVAGPIQVVFSGIPRPTDEEDVVDVEAEEEDDDAATK